MSHLVHFERYKCPLQHFNKFKDDGLGHNMSSVIDDQLGMFPLPSETYLAERFNFWLCELGFRLTPRLLKAINTCDGIETVDIYTPYRFRIGIARVFDEDSVKKALTDRLVTTYTKVKEANASQKIQSLSQSVLSKHCPCWAILGDGVNQQVITGTSRDNLDVKISAFLDTHKGYEVIERKCE